MAQPVLHVYLGAAFNPDTADLFDEPSSWTEITAEVREAAWQRGRQRELDEISVGTGSLLLRNETRNFDPTNTDSPYFPLDDRQVKIEASFASGSFPSAGVGTLDSFTRANEGPPMTGWTTYVSSGLKVLSNQCAPDDTIENAAYWNTSMVGSDVEAFITISTKGANGCVTQLNARLDPASGTYGTCYGVDYRVAAGTDTIRLKREDGASGVTIAGPWNQELAAGDAIGIRCVGSTIEAWARISGAWTLIGSATDETYAGTGTNNKIGLYNEGAGTSASRYDDFGGGVNAYSLFRGWTVNWHVVWEGSWEPAEGQRYSETQVELVDAISLFQAWPVTVPPGNDSISARIAEVLTAIGFPTGMRALAGGSTVQSVVGMTRVWEHFQGCVRSDTGLRVCYVDGRGYVIFGSVTDSGVTLGDGGGDELPYAAAGLNYGTDLVYSEVKVTREGGTPQTASIRGNAGGSPHGIRAYERSTLNITDADAFQVAQAIYARYQAPAARPEPVTIRPGNNTELWEQVLSLDLEHTLTFKRRPPTST